MSNKKYMIILVLFVTQSLLGQKNFSFLDCVTVSASGNYVFNYGYKHSEKVSIHNYYTEYEDEDALRLNNYYSYSVEAKYFLKAYKNIRIGLGMEYTMRKASFEFVSSPKSWRLAYPLVITKYDKKFHLFGPSLNLSFAIPKWRLRATIFESYLFLRNRKVYSGSHYYHNFYSFRSGNEYLDGYKIGIVNIDELPEGLRIPVSALVRGVEVQYRIGKRVYLLLQFRRMDDGFHVGIQHRYYENVNGVEQEYSIGTSGTSGGARHQVGVGVAYHFFGKD